jgi:protein-tyrosine-phosphatase
MAEAIARSIGGDDIEALSAGLSPLGWVAGQTIDALRALGHPVDGLSSKGFDDVDFEHLDVVVSLLGDRGLDVIPHGLAVERESWTITDPFGEDDELYLEVAREIEARVRRLLEEHRQGELFSS